MHLEGLSRAGPATADIRLAPSSLPPSLPLSLSLSLSLPSSRIGAKGAGEKDGWVCAALLSWIISRKIIVLWEADVGEVHV